MLSTDNDNREDARDEAETVAGHGMSNIRAATTASPFAPSPELFHPPRLGIIHLLAWTAVSAVLMKVFLVGWLGSVHDTFSGWVRVLFIANSSTHMILIAGGVVGTCVILRAKYCGIGGRLQAGHWIMINISSTSILSWVGHKVLTSMSSWLEMLYDSNYPSPYVYALYLILAAPQFILAILWAVGSTRMGESYGWKAMFGILAVCSVGGGCLYLSLIFSPSFGSLLQLPISALLTLLLLPAVVLIDFTRRVPRDWLHWLGIAMIFITSISAVTISIAFWLFPPSFN